jgi:hypothetical protein
MAAMVMIVVVAMHDKEVTAVVFEMIPAMDDRYAANPVFVVSRWCMIVMWRWRFRSWSYVIWISGTQYMRVGSCAANR